MFLNAIECENEIMEKKRKNSSLQTKKNRGLKMMKKIKIKIWNYYISKGKGANFIIGMLHVGHFFM
jgi:hypothetical protein